MLNEPVNTVGVAEEKPVLLIKASNGDEILRFEGNGDIFVKGNPTTNDMDVVNGFRELLQLSHLM